MEGMNIFKSIILLSGFAMVLTSCFTENDKKMRNAAAIAEQTQTANESSDADEETKRWNKGLVSEVHECLSSDGNVSCIIDIDWYDKDRENSKFSNIDKHVITGMSVYELCDDDGCKPELKLTPISGDE